MIVKQEAAMKKMCLVMLTALIIIICVIAFQTLRESRKEVFDGILIEENTGRSYDTCLYLVKKEQNGGIL